jgi:hypothetical protein
MAMGRTLQHRLLKPGSLHSADASKGMAWRPVVLICAAILAAALASYSLIVDPPGTRPAPASYLP